MTQSIESRIRNEAIDIVRKDMEDYMALPAEERGK